MHDVNLCNFDVEWEGHVNFQILVGNSIEWRPRYGRIRIFKNEFFFVLGADDIIICWLLLMAVEWMCNL